MRSAKKPTTAAVKPTAMAANIQKALPIDSEARGCVGTDAGCEATGISFCSSDTNRKAAPFNGASRPTRISLRT